MARALLPLFCHAAGNLWKPGETSRRVKDLAGAFAYSPHLPKMLKAQAILDTLVNGCIQGAFVFRLPRPDRTFRTWWRSRPDDTALTDPAMELVLPEAAELADIAPDLMAPKALPALWPGDEIAAQDAMDYFAGGKTVQVDKGGYQEPVIIPKASTDVVFKAIGEAVAAGRVWLLSGPATLLNFSMLYCCLPRCRPYGNISDVLWGPLIRLYLPRPAVGVEPGIAIADEIDACGGLMIQLAAAGRLE